MPGAISHAHQLGASGVCLPDLSNVNGDPVDGWFVSWLCFSVINNAGGPTIVKGMFMVVESLLVVREFKVA